MSVLYTLPVGRAFPTAIITHFNLNVKMAIPYGDEPFSWCTGDCCQLLEDEETGEVFNLTEIIDITQYLLEKVDTEESKVLLGGDCIQNKTSVIKWMSLWNSDIVSKLIVLYSQVEGTENFNKKTFDAAKADVETIIVDVVEARLRDFTYLVGKELTAADYFAAAMSAFSFMFLFDKAWVAKHPVFMRWFNTVKAQPLIAGMFAKFSILDIALAPPQKKKAAKAPEKKAKHPLEALGKSSKFVLDEWKRQYSNNDTRPVALPWFFENFDASEWSVWRVDYKYNDELTMTFMSNNLVGGFFNRLTGSIKYMFGCLVVYGENNANGIVGAILVRGQDYKPAFDVAPDWESYAYTKLDVTKEDDKKFIENMWAWDKPVVVDGTNKEIADGKVLK